MKFKICGVKEVEEIIKIGKIKEFTYCISIGDPNAKYPEQLNEFKEKLLRLEFVDIDEATSWQSGLPDWRDLPDIAPNPEIVKKILAFSEKFLNDDSISILIHCHMGVSRSTATGLIILYKKLQNEKQAMDVLLSICEDPLPNTYLIGYADQIMNSNLSDIIPRFGVERFKKD